MFLVTFPIANPVNNQYIVANFEASNISINIAVTNIPTVEPIKLAMKTVSKELSKVNLFNEKYIEKKIKPNDNKPKTPVSPKARRYSLSVAKVVDE